MTAADCCRTLVLCHNLQAAWYDQQEAGAPRLCMHHIAHSTFSCLAGLAPQTPAQGLEKHAAEASGSPHFSAGPFTSIASPQGSRRLRVGPMTAASRQLQQSLSSTSSRQPLREAGQLQTSQNSGKGALGKGLGAEAGAASGEGAAKVVRRSMRQQLLAAQPRRKGQ